MRVKCERCDSMSEYNAELLTKLQSQAALIEKCEHAIKSACRYDIKYGHNLEVVLAEIAKWKERGK